MSKSIQKQLMALRNAIVHDMSPLDHDELQERLRSLMIHMSDEDMKSFDWVLMELHLLLDIRGRRTKGPQLRVTRFYVALRQLWENDRVRRPPGARINSFAEFLFPKKTYERVFRPVIKDLQDEYVAALAQDRRLKAHWVWWRGHFAFWQTFVLQLSTSLVRQAFNIWKAAS